MANPRYNCSTNNKRTIWWDSVILDSEIRLGTVL
jgi:hypothetical protein